MTTDVEESDEPEEEGPSDDPEVIEAACWEAAEAARRKNLKLLSDITRSQSGPCEELEKPTERAKTTFLTKAYRAMAAIAQSIIDDYERDDDEPFVIDTSRFGKDM